MRAFELSQTLTYFKALIRFYLQRSFLSTILTKIYQGEKYEKFNLGNSFYTYSI